MALTGGRTPDVVYEALLKKEIDWSKVTLLPTDDRLVPLDHPLSNYAKLPGLFGKTGAEIVSLIDEAALGDYRAAVRLGVARLARLDWPLDLVMLRVGPAGHTASLFPGPALDRAIPGPRARRALGVRPAPLP